jgi:GT2 family glycosyltransferase
MLHGYDFDLCRQVRARGGKVVCADLLVAHHHPLDLVKDIEIWVAAHMRAADLWDEQQLSEDQWRARARQAEASAAAARLLAASKLLQADAATQQGERELELIRGSRSWRLTEPLRRGNSLLRAARGRRATASAR